MLPERFHNAWWLAFRVPHNQIMVDTDTEWYWGKRGGTLFLSFEGSGSALDWKQNFRFHRRAFRDMRPKFRTHTGFDQKWRSIREDVMALITEDVERVLIAGYSQGAALALRAHEEIWFHHPLLRPWTHTTVFGCPRVFSWHAPRERFRRVERIDNGWDIVTGVPWVLLGYKHVGTRVHLGRRPRWLHISVRDHIDMQGWDTE